MAPSDEVPTSHAPAGLSLPVRIVLVIVGTVSLALGVIGIFLPVLPTTPFLLVTAACYARASDRLYRWLLGQPSLGPIVIEWRRSRSLPPGVKTRALIVVAITFAISIVLVDIVLIRIALIVIAAILMIFLYRIPSASADADSMTMRTTPPSEERR